MDFLVVLLVVGVPAIGLRWLCRAITREIASWAPDPARPEEPRYQLVQVIPQRTQAPASRWPSDSWPPAD